MVIPMNETVGFISLGCAKNQVDSERMLSRLRDAGYRIINEPEDADAVVVNTCGFIDAAKSEGIETLLELGELKKEGRIKAIVAVGCLMQRYGAQMKEELPEVDAVLGTGSYDEVANAVREALEGNRFESFKDINAAPEEGARVQSTPWYTAYLKVAEGCDNRCTYCVIPSLKGRYRSRPMESLLAEARELAEKGVFELNLVAQDTTRYGEDLYGEGRLPELLTELCKIEGLKWIRVLYCYPDKVTDRLLEVFAREDKIVKYIDIPIQHASDRMLRAMNRRGSRESLLALFDKIRERVPGVTLRTTLITGFPGETEEDFAEMMEFIRQVRFERLGVFTYSDEEGSPASRMDCKVPGEEAARRQELLMLEQSRMADERNQSLVGRTVEVLCEGYDRVAECSFGRTREDAPEIDGKVFFKSASPAEQGTLVMVKISEVVDYDLFGETVEG